MRKKQAKNRLVIQKFTVYDVLIYIFLAMFAFLALYPFIFTLAGSLNDAIDLMYGPIWVFPRKFTLASYVVEFNDRRLYRAFLNTFISMSVTIVLHLLITSCGAYAASSKRLKYRRFFWYFNLITMFISGGMIPSYMVILLTRLYDNFLVYIIPSLYSVFNMIVISNFFKSIDDGLYEAAVIDGASEFRIWLTIFLPLSKPVIATVCLWVGVGKWNSYMPTMLYTSKDEDIWLLQYYLMRLIREGATPDYDSQFSGQVSAKTLSLAAIVISSLPILCAYPFISRFFSKGIMLGSLKG